MRDKKIKTTVKYRYVVPKIIKMKNRHNSRTRWAYRITGLLTLAVEMEKNAEALENSVLVCEEALCANICWVLVLLC